MQTIQPSEHLLQDTHTVGDIATPWSPHPPLPPSVPWDADRGYSPSLSSHLFRLLWSAFQEPYQWTRNDRQSGLGMFAPITLHR